MLLRASCLFLPSNCSGSSFSAKGRLNAPPSFLSISPYNQWRRVAAQVMDVFKS